MGADGAKPGRVANTFAFSINSIFPIALRYSNRLPIVRGTPSNPHQETPTSLDPNVYSYSCNASTYD